VGRRRSARPPAGTLKAIRKGDCHGSRDSSLAARRAYSDHHPAGLALAIGPEESDREHGYGRSRTVHTAGEPYEVGVWVLRLGDAGLEAVADRAEGLPASRAAAAGRSTRGDAAPMAAKLDKQRDHP
jgi:hypothetical protein